MMHPAEQQLKEMQAEFESAMRDLNAAREAHEREVKDPLMRTMIGRCFVYPNTFGGGETWPLYTRIVGVLEGQFLVLNIQKTSAGRISIEQGTWNFGSEAEPLSGGYAPIGPHAYVEAVEPLLEEVRRQALH